MIFLVEVLDFDRKYTWMSSYKSEKKQIFYIIITSRVKARFRSILPQQYFEFRATLQHWLAQRFQNEFEEERFQKPGFTC